MSEKPFRIISKPAPREAMLWRGDNIAAIRDWLGPDIVKEYDGYIKIWNEELKVWLNVPQGFYIIKGIKGEFYPCSSEVMHRTYEIYEQPAE